LARRHRLGIGASNKCLARRFFFVPNCGHGSKIVLCDPPRACVTLVFGQRHHPAGLSPGCSPHPVRVGVLICLPRCRHTPDPTLHRSPAVPGSCWPVEPAWRRLPGSDSSPLPPYCLPLSPVPHGRLRSVLAGPWFLGTRRVVPTPWLRVRPTSRAFSSLVRPVAWPRQRGTIVFVEGILTRRWGSHPIMSL